MTKHTAKRRSELIAEEAAEWFIALRTPDAKAKSEFVEWLRASPEHVSEYLSIAALWEMLPQAKGQPSPGELVRLAAGTENVVELGQCDVGAERSSSPVQTAHRGSGLSRWFLGAAAAALAGAAALGVLTQFTGIDPNLYATEIGEQASISLPDGSIVTLNTRSTVRFEYGDSYRDVKLLSGEALFDVSKDPARPFRVMADSVVVQAVGTQFNVRKRSSDVTVTVVEGMVDVSASKGDRAPAGKVARRSDGSGSPSGPAPVQPVRLAVGQQARVQSRSGQVSVVETTVTEAIAWQERRLVFESITLGRVIEEFNRYNHPPLEIDDPSLEQLPISGIFRAHDRESFVLFLSEMRLAESYQRADGTIVLRAVTEK